jgi:hypothetical protein
LKSTFYDDMSAIARHDGPELVDIVGEPSISAKFFNRCPARFTKIVGDEVQ